MNAPQTVAAVLLLACGISADHGISARHAYSASSSGSNAFASSSAGSVAGAGVIPNPAAFWWAGPDSPFKEAHEYFRRCSQKGDCGNIPGPFPGIPQNLPNNVPSNGCNSNGCSFSGNYNINDKVQHEKDSDFGPIDISKNPFLNGEYKGVAVSSCSGHGCPNGKPHTTITTTQCKGSDCKTNTQQGAPGDIGFGDNKFFGGLFTGAGAGSGSFGNTGGSGCQYNCGQAPAQNEGCSSGGCSNNQNVQSSGGGTGCSGVKGGCNGGSYTGSGQFSGSTAGAGSYYPNQSGQPGLSGQPSYHGQPGQQGQFGQTDKPGYQKQPGQQGQPGQFGHSGQPGQTGQPGYPGQPGQAGQPGYPGQPGQTGQPGQPGHLGQPGQPGHPGHHGQPGQTNQPGQPGQHGQPGQPGQLGLPEQIGPDDYNKFKQPIPTTYPGQRPNTDYSGSFATSGTKDYSSTSQLGQTTAGQFGNTYGQQPVPTKQPGQSTPGGFAGTHNQPSDSQHPENGAACYGQGLICVRKHLCVNGLVNNDGEGLLNVRHGEKYCEPNTEVCCQLPGSSGQPHKDINLQLPNQPGPGGQSFYTTASHQSSAASAASSSASSSGSTYFTSNLPNTDSVPRFSTPGPNKAPQPAFNPGVYQPTKSNNQPGANQYQPGVNQYQPGSNYQPGQTINFEGKDGTSPGVIQVVPDGQTGSRTQAPDLVRPSQPTQGPQPGLTHILPNGQNSSPDGAASTYQPNYAQGSTNPNQLTDVHNELNFASTIQGPAYLPPGPFPSPSPSNYSPDLLPPNRPSYPQQPSPRPTPRQEYSPTTPKSVYSSTPAPTTYYPTTKFQQPSTSGYLPPYSGSPTQTQGSFITTKKPQVTNGYLPPNQIPSASGGDNSYLPPPNDRTPDSNIINISVLRPNPDPIVPVNDRDPAPTNPDQTFLRPSSPRPTDFGQNTTPYPGCAAALKCVTEDFCTAEGVISPVQVILTKEQQTNRVPLTECSDPESGIIGKCCRDPEYKDPWPSTQLGLFNPDQDGAGSNNGPNRLRPNNRPPPTNPGVKGGRRPQNPYEPNQIGSPSNNPNAVIRPGGYPTHVPNIPFDSRLLNVPVPVDVQPPIETDYSQKVESRTKIAGENCGIRHPDSNPKGQEPIDANFAEIPWQAMILRDTNRSLLCGGAIIRKDVVLTAAHCVENLQANDVLVKGGEWKLGIDEEPKPFQINKVATIVRHPGYNPQTRLNDIALLILNEKFRSDRNVDTLCLPDPNEDIAKTFQKAKCITTGWGKTILQLNIVNSVMHILGVGILPGSQCQQQLQQYHSDSAYLYNTNCVCGAPVQPQTDICDVDVGSALACDRGDGRYTLAGIYSWDTGCNPTAQIAGYTKVDTHWIESTLQRPIKDLRTEERGFYAQLQAQGSAQECHCLPGK